MKEKHNGVEDIEVKQFTVNRIDCIRYGIDAALILSVYRTIGICADGRGYIRATRDDIQRLTTVSPTKQAKALNTLIAEGAISVEIRQVPCSYVKERWIKVAD